jgi:hypothetical protein
LSILSLRKEEAKRNNEKNHEKQGRKERRFFKSLVFSIDRHNNLSAAENLID